MRQKKKYDKFIGLRISKGMLKGLEVIANKRKLSVSELIRFMISGITGMLMVLFLVQACYAKTITASWYNRASCLREGTSGIMANGRELNDNELICASWDYSFGTRLRITNVDNNKSVEVEVTDRGPAKRLYRQGRKVDLSYAAMHRLDGIRKGIIPITIEVLS